MSDNNHHALVLGASGLAGWAVVDELLSNYPSEGTFAKVTALVNRPLKAEDTYWPLPSADRPKLQLVDGVDLTRETPEEFAKVLLGKGVDMGSVTHVYYFAYRQDDDHQLEIKTNCGMLERLVDTLNLVSTKFKFLAWPSGTMASPSITLSETELTSLQGYGIYHKGGLLKAPLVETMDPLPEPYRSGTWYYTFQQILKTKSEGKSWTWCQVRPDAIVGFAPSGSTYSLAAHWAVYLSLYALVEGKGAKVPFPGNEAAWHALWTDASSSIIARAAIWASLHPEKTAGELFNVADEARPVTNKERWPALAAYFGLEGTSPAGDDSSILKPSEYVTKHAHILAAKGLKVQVWQGGHLDLVGYNFDFDKQLSLDKIRSAGFTEERDSIKSWLKTFDKFKAAGMIL
ncbi:hypothetical protein OE88DRAFT_1739080 [Heliocybe sulcata]|uniref:PRISE-like Rossmann-fold domain-containing protein n=1 Tax=Heliocybe sulcata TaxID=5364 RepID=A0A5C3MQH0_9AGAM|nr:hypothetical protein OE88DRAFT_1739080 [Heliocybe sulcata]